ncbi:hypothetical protein SDC9_209438 [bioreactor metagenome]|uniref:Uncharacterized protein n=1 Tax=bioreactor metagenome TaxID=1076179 RepID=A0A645JE12_9ZZZZ
MHHVTYDQHWHVCRGDAAHRADGANMVARDKFHFALIQETDSFLFTGRPPLKQRCADTGTSHGSRHRFPGNRRAGVQQFTPGGQFNHRLFRRTDSNPMWAGGFDAFNNGVVGLCN